MEEKLESDLFAYLLYFFFKFALFNLLVLRIEPILRFHQHITGSVLFPLV